LVPQQGGGEIYDIFRKDIVEGRWPLYVDDTRSPVGGDCIAWLRGQLDNDLGMLKEISALCNQGCLGGAAVSLLMQNPMTPEQEAKFLNALGMPFNVWPGSTKAKFKIHAIKKHHGEEHVWCLKIRAKLIVDDRNFAHCWYWCDKAGRPASMPSEQGHFALSALKSVQVDLSLSVMQFSKGKFQYELFPIDLTLDTRPDNPEKETPAEILKMC
jgi:hypothetical protein